MTFKDESVPRTVETSRHYQAGQIRLSTASGLVYKAFRRPYGSGPVSVLNLYASGYYSNAPWEMSFQPVAGQTRRYQLMEKVPTFVYEITSYYTASYSSLVGLKDLGDTVVVVDAQGGHIIPVEPLNEGVFSKRSPPVPHGNRSIRALA